MGLSVSVGIVADLLEHDTEGAEWFRQALAVANRVLADEGLATFDEPTEFDHNQSRSGLDGMSYSEVHHVRRAFAFGSEYPGVVMPPMPPGENPARDPILNRFVGDFFCHLVNHSDAEGFYVPVRFGEILFDDALPGAILGSSYKLREELVIAAGALGINVVDGVLADAEATRINDLDYGDQRARGKHSWLAHWEAARLSIEHGAAVVYT